MQFLGSRSIEIGWTVLNKRLGLVAEVPCNGSRYRQAPPDAGEKAIGWLLF